MGKSDGVIFLCFYFYISLRDFIRDVVTFEVRATPPDFGPNVKIFDPSMPTSQIQMDVGAIADQQIPNQSGSSATHCCSCPAPMDI
jgi:hypothetical protein